MNHLHKSALGCATATIGALCMILFWLLGNTGMNYGGYGSMMNQLDPAYSMSGANFLFALIMMIVLGFIGGYLFGWVYNYCLDHMHNKSK